MPQLALTLSGQPVDLPPDAQVALSYRVNDVRTLDSREAAFSETFTLPNTARNRRVLGNPHELASLTDSPYQLLPAVLTSPGGAVLLEGCGILSSSGEGFELILTDAVGALFAVVGNRGLRELDLQAYDHRLRYDDLLAADGNDYTQGYTYALFDTGILSARRLEQGLTPDELPASVFYHALLQAMLTAPLPPVPVPSGYTAPVNPLAGYKLTGSLFADPTYQAAVLPRATALPQLRGSYVHAYTAKGYYSVDRTYTQGTVLQFADVVQGNLFAGSFYLPPPHAVGLRIQVRIPLTTSGSGCFITLYQEDGPPGARVATPLHYEPLQYDAGRHLVAYDLNYEVVQATATTTFYLSLDIFGTTTVVISAGASLTITPHTRALPEAPVHLEAGLPDMSQADFLKLLFNQFNVILQADPLTKTLRFDLFNDVEKNRGVAVDWTPKLDTTRRPRLHYRLEEYAQANQLGYAAVPSQYREELPIPAAPYDADARGQAALQVRDATLPATREAYAAELLLPLPRATTAISYSGGASGIGRAAELLWVPLFTPADYTKAAEAWDSQHDYERDNVVFYLGQTWVCTIGDGKKTRAVPPSGNNRQYQIADQAWEVTTDFFATANDSLDSVASLSTYVGNLQVKESGLHGRSYVPTRQLSRSALHFERLLRGYYPTLASACERTLLLTVDVRLNALDIAGLDFTVPVRLGPLDIQGYGRLHCVGYLSLIDQWQPGNAGQAVEALLLVLGLPVPGLAPLVPMPGGQLLPTGNVLINEEATAFLLSEDGYYIVLE